VAEYALGFAGDIPPPEVFLGIGQNVERPCFGRYFYEKIISIAGFCCAAAVSFPAEKRIS
jgi:hypothetical protein